MTKRKKILFHSNFCKAFTGFGKNSKNVLKYLFNTNKYEIIEAANGFSQNHVPLSKMPWKCIGTLPSDQAKIRQLNKDPNLARSASYGSETIDDIIKDIQPDIYVGAEDIWAFNEYWNRKWWNKMNCMVWTTIDSQPMLPLAVDAANYINNYYVWAGFAEREMAKLGHTHVKTLHGIVDCSNFKNLGENNSSQLRKLHNIEEDAFIVGFVFRNQLRKSVPNLLDGFKVFQKNNPECKAKLLLHTHWDEGWDIPRLLKEKNIDNSDILTTYFCPKCNKYEIKPYSGQELDCPFCGAKKSQKTTNVSAGVSEHQLNEIYNLMDVYCHPFTSGGQEIPIQEAKLCELITLVTNYSCGEEHCTSASAGFPLEWSEYREPGTQFIKASTYPSSISKQLTKVYKMSKPKRSSMGRKARQFVIDNYSVEVIGKKLEKIFDEMPFCEWDFDFTDEPRNPDYDPPQIQSDSDWLVDIYKNILKMDVVAGTDKGHTHWIKKIKEGLTREEVLSYFKKVANEENSKINSSFNFEDILGNEGPSKRVAVVMPESAGDVLMVNSIISNLKKLYPNHNIYFITKTQFRPLIEDNPDVYRILPYQEEMDNLLLLEGSGQNEGFFDIAYLPHIGTQRILNYMHNGRDRIALDLYEN
jgi:glycosyltransferase involved in cell wall biosynthesis